MKDDKIEFNFFAQSYAQFLILEALTFNEKMLSKELFDYVVEKSNPSLLSASVKQLNIYLLEMVSIGLIDLEDIPELRNQEQQSFSITEAGIEALRNRTFQSVASSAFFNRQAIRLSRRTLYLSIISVGIALISIFISISSSNSSYIEYHNMKKEFNEIRKILINTDSVEFKLNRMQLNEIISANKLDTIIIIDKAQATTH